MKRTLVMIVATLLVASGASAATISVTDLALLAAEG